MDKLREMHIELNNKYEEKFRQAIMYLVDRIEWQAFYDQLARIVAIWDEIKGDEDKLKPIVQKWSERNNGITTMCISVIQLPCHQIENIFHFLNKPEDFDSK